MEKFDRLKKINNNLNQTIDDKYDNLQQFQGRRYERIYILEDNNESIQTMKLWTF